MVLSPLLINHTQKIQRLTARSLSQSQGHASSRPRPGIFEAKATKFCPRGVLEVEASPRGPHPWYRVAVCCLGHVKKRLID